MKCYRCENEIHDELHCPHCGALLKPTKKLMTAIQAHDREAIVQLYHMTAHQISYKLRAKGLDDQTSHFLINKAFKELLEGIQKADDVQGYSKLLDGVCDDTAYSYIIKHHLDIQECLVEDQLLPITDEDVDQLFKDLHTKTEVSKRAQPRKPKIIGFLAIAVAIACGVGIYTFQKPSAPHKVSKTVLLKAYAKVGDAYVQVVEKLYETDHVTDSFKKKYQTAYKAAQVVHYHNKVCPQLKQSLYDVDHDGVKELIIGYSLQKKFFITGIYRYAAKNHQATSLNIIKDIKHYYNTVLSDQNKIVVMKNKESGIAYSLKDQQLKTVKKHVSGISTYLGSHQKKLKAEDMNSLHSQLDVLANDGKVYKVINKNYKDEFKTKEYDLDQDGQNDQLEIMPVKAPSRGSYIQYLPYYFVKVNGKSVKVKEPYDEVYTQLNTYILRGKNGSMFILVAHNTGSDICYWKLLVYRQHKVVTLLQTTDMGKNTGDQSFAFSDVSVKGNSLTIKEYADTEVFSDFCFTKTYRMEKGSLQQETLSYAIMPDRNMIKENSLEKEKMVLRTSSALTTYTTPDCTFEGIKIPSGVNVEIPNFYLEKGFNAYAIKYQGQIGYIKSTDAFDANNQNKYFRDLYYPFINYAG